METGIRDTFLWMYTATLSVSHSELASTKIDCPKRANVRPLSASLHDLAAPKRPAESQKALPAPIPAESAF